MSTIKVVPRKGYIEMRIQERILTSHTKKRKHIKSWALRDGDPDKYKEELPSKTLENLLRG